MRLLTKLEIDKAKSIDRSREVAEGLKLSRRVDGLRELAAKEEADLSKFRNSSLREISKEIAELTAKRDDIAQEAKALKKEMESETSLSREERKNLEALKKDLKRKEEELKEKSFSVDLKEIDVLEAKRAAEAAVARKVADELRTAELQRTAAYQQEEAEKTLNRAKKREEETIDFKTKTENELVAREKQIVEKETANDLKTKENLKLEKELNTLKIQLADQRATLERAMERLRKNRQA